MSTAEVRFFLARITDIDGCILWTGSLSDNGYPVMRVGPRYRVSAHRWVWERLNGPIAEGVDIDHICHVKICVNPAHLRAISRTENRSDGWLRLARRSRRDAVLHVPAPLAALAVDDEQLVLW